jgi:Domain of unknown function (DUF4082)/Fibronectin type III domain/Bacterial Ig domain
MECPPRPQRRHATAGFAVPRARIAGLLVVAALAILCAAPEASWADACTPPVTSPVACENTLPGADPSTWQITGVGDPAIQGFATSMSVNKGDTIAFKIKSATPNYRIDILRLGYYGGDGARVVASNLAPTNTAAQPNCQTFPATGLIDCGNWSVSRSWTVPADAVSGVYIAHLKPDAGGDGSHITFVVRDDASDSDIVLQTSDATWQAYNTYGGNSTYTCSVACPPGNPAGYKGAFKVSYNRPFNTAEDDSGRSALFTGGEWPMIRFLEASGYDVSYVSSVDVHRRGQLLLNHDLFISSGHDEYWSATQRASMEAARDAGVNLAFFTGNTGFWKTRWEPSADGSNTQDRTLVTYKDTHFEAQQDPVEWTGTWRDPRFTTEADGVTPENALSGLSFLVNSGTSRITVPYEYGGLRMWRNTAAATLSPGQTLQLAPATLGYEWDVDADNGFRPAGQFRLSSTTVSGLEAFTDYGSTVTTGATATHNMTMYRKPGGGRVFNSGSVQWSWGLDAENNNGNPVDNNMRQATVNLFADMGAQPVTLLPGLVAASASTDATAPTSTITAPPATVADGAQVTITGTATDAGGGRVAGVEVSTDGGSTWHPATNGTTSWSYTWIAHGNPSTTIRSRAVDDSGNIESPAAGHTVDVSCPCSIWGANVAPARPDDGDPSPIEVGVKFRSDSYGSISGVRFYRSAANSGTHTGSLWTAGGQRLAQATFTGETASGWQTVTFDNPVEVQPGTTYVASYHAPNGHYAATADYFYRAPSPGPNGGAMVDSPPLHGLRNTGSTTNGVYVYSATSAFPVNSFRAANYWVDVVFSPIPAPGTVTNVVAAEAGRTSADVSWTAPASGGNPTAYKITPYIGSTPQTPKTITGSPPATSTTMTGLTNGTTYRFTVQAINPTGAGPESAPSNAVTPTAPVAPSAPLDTSAQPASQSARVQWSPPGSDGDSPLTGYTVTPYIGGTAQAPVQVGPAATSTVITGLTNGTAYTFRVTASNAVGTSPASAPTGAVKPQATLLEFTTPAVVDVSDENPVELGVKFFADHDGLVTGIRFYKSAANTGTHIGSLWNTGGQRLAQVTFTGETASGWQSATFATPVAVTAGTTYVASYFAPRGHYSATGGGFNTALDNPPLHAHATTTSANGVYTYAATSSFPTNTYNGANYSVDVLYAVPQPGQVTGVTAAEGGTTSADVSWSPPAGGGPVSSYKVTPYVGGSAQTPKTVGGSATSTTVTGLTTGTTYRFTVRAVNANGEGAESALSNAVTPQAAVAPSAPTAVSAQPATESARVSWTAPGSDGDSPITGYTVTPYIGTTAQTPVQVGAGNTSTVIGGLTNGTSYTFRVRATNAVGTGPASDPSGAAIPRATIFDFATPSVPDAGDGSAVELGVKFRADFDGSITGVRYYKAAANTGTHVGSLWTTGGQRLAHATFSGGTGSGWQSVTFSSPVAITAGTTYIASYHAPNGHYSVTGGGFSSAVDNGLLRALDSASSPNGVYAYGPAGSFPTNSFNAGNYWVDVLYAPAGAPGQVTGVQASAGQASANVSWTAPASGGPATSYTVTPFIGTTAQTPKTVTGSPPATSTTVTGLTPGTEYTFTVRASNPSGSGPVSAPSGPVTPLGATAPSAPANVAATPDTKSAWVSWDEPASDGGSPITGYTVTPFVGGEAQTPVTVGAVTRTRVSGLTNGTQYTFRVSATNAVGTGAASAASNAVAPEASIFDFATPAVVDAGDGSSVVLGVKFTADVSGTVTGIRFYKAAANTGTHVGTLWSAGGQSLRQATFSGESASGWQSVRFDTPVAVTAGTTYVAAYLAPNGHYSVNGAAFASGPVDNPPLHALANLASSNGVYAYSSSSVFPSNTWNSTNYWVDVLFAPGA